MICVRAAPEAVTRIGLTFDPLLNNMKKILVACGCLFLLNQATAQSSTTTLDVVSWNVEFFGAPYNSGPPNKDLQESNVKRIMRFLDADLYGLCEIVDTLRLRRLVDSLGNTEYGFVIAPYCSNNTTGTGASWTSGQKLAYIYRKSVFSNITARGVMRNSSTAYTNWASGRFPYLFSATATVNGVSRPVNFFLLHGKAGNTQEDYTRRQGAANELKDTLDTYFSTSLNFIIGDFNDALNTSIFTGAPVSSYNSIVADSTDSDHYKSITLPLGAAGQTSMINFPNVIDNHVISNEVTPFYIPGSARVVTNVTSVVPDYVTAHNTSDHYPIFSNYSLSGIVTGLPVVPASELGMAAYPNPFHGLLFIKVTQPRQDITLHLFNSQGQLLETRAFPRWMPGQILEINRPGDPAGIYYLRIQTSREQTSLKLIRH